MLSGSFGLLRNTDSNSARLVGVGSGMKLENEVIVRSPSGFEAVTSQRIERPSWSAVILKVDCVAPAIGAELEPEKSSRNHW